MRTLILSTLLFFLCGSASALDLRLEPSRVSTSPGEHFYIQVHISDSRGADCKVDFPPHHAFEISEAGISQTQSVRIIGTQVERDHTWIRNYIVRAKEIGEFTLGPVRVTIAGQTYTTASSTIHVQAGRAPQTQGQIFPGRDRHGFMDFFPRDTETMAVYVETLFDKKTAWVGEGVVQYVDIHANRPRVVGVQFAQASRDGFWEILPEKYAQERPLRYVRDGKEWYRYRYATAYLFPLTSGVRTVPPFAVRVDYNQLWTRTQLFQTDTLRLEARPLPADAGGNFSGAVGQFTLAGGFDEHGGHFAKDQPFTLSLTVSGFGNVRSLSAPVFSESALFRIMPPQLQSQVEIRDGQVYGTQSFRYLVYPLAAGNISLPEARLRAFDPAAGRYYDLVYTAPGLEVAQAAAGASGEEAHKKRADAEYDFSPPESEFPRSALPLGLAPALILLVLVLAFFTLGIARERRRRLDASNPRLALRRHAAKHAHTALRSLPDADTRETASSLIRVLRAYVSERTGAGQGSTFDALAEALRGDHAREESIEAWKSFEEDCTALSYGMGHSPVRKRGRGQESSASLVAAARTLVDNFEESRA